MRLFLYNYNVDENWPITRAQGVFGVSIDRTGMDTKAIRDLQIGDVVIVRDSSFSWSDCRIFGTCVIAGPLVRQSRGGSPWEDLLWHDERKRRRIVYPLRWPVEFKDAPFVGRTRIPWPEFDRLNMRGSRGQLIAGRGAWQMKFRGNLIESPAGVRALSELMWFRT